MENIRDIATFVIQQVLDDQQPFYDEQILCHIWAKDKFSLGQHRYSLQQWFYLKSGKPLKKTKYLKSRTNNKFSIDINDLYY